MISLSFEIFVYAYTLPPEDDRPLEIKKMEIIHTFCIWNTFDYLSRSNRYLLRSVVFSDNFSDTNSYYIHLYKTIKIGRIIK